jgi:hypothetical protein
MLKIAATMAKLTAYIVMVAGGTLTGLLGGWNLGPIHWDVSRVQSGCLGAFAGLFLAGLGCHFASERAEARARNQMQAQVLQRLLRIAPR